MKVWVVLLLASTYSRGALLFTFTEEGNDVIMRSTGALTLDPLFFPLFSINQPNFTGGLNDNGFSSEEIGGAVAIDKIAHRGTDLLVGNFSSKTLLTGGLTHGVAFEISESLFYLDSSSRDYNNLGDVIYSGRSFSDLGLDHHAENANIPLWEGAGVSSGDGLISFRIQTAPVPEPSSLSLFGIAAFCTLLKRRRGAVARGAMVDE